MQFIVGFTVFFLMSTTFLAVETVHHTIPVATINKCMELNNISGSDKKTLQAGKLVDSTPKTNVMCHMKCVLNGLGVLDGDHLKESSFLEYFKPSLGKAQAQKVYDTCHELHGKKQCETSYKIYRCMAKNMKNSKH